MVKKEEEKSWLPWEWSPDRWITFAALLVSICALAISFYAGLIERTHNKLSVRPNLHISFHVSEKGAGWLFENNGFGPALVQGVQVTVDGKPKLTWREFANALGLSPTTDFEYINIKKGVVVKSGDANPLFRVFTRPEFEMVVDAQKTNRVLVKICFCSFYEECWLASSKQPATEWVNSCGFKEAEFRGALE